MTAPACPCGRQTVRRVTGWWCTYCHRTALPRRRRRSEQKIAEGKRAYRERNRARIAERKRAYCERNRSKER
ncbi:MAG: hypothetical protein ACREMZ_14395 [Gemmatimonadales bacterium]